LEDQPLALFPLAVPEIETDRWSSLAGQFRTKIVRKNPASTHGSSDRQATILMLSLLGIGFQGILVRKIKANCLKKATLEIGFTSTKKNSDGRNQHGSHQNPTASDFSKSKIPPMLQIHFQVEWMVTPSFFMKSLKEKSRRGRELGGEGN